MQASTIVARNMYSRPLLGAVISIFYSLFTQPRTPGIEGMPCAYVGIEYSTKKGPGGVAIHAWALINP
jgi:hypothetical protein